MNKIQVNLLNLSMLSKLRDALYSDASGQRSACGMLCLIKTICLPLLLVLGLAACAQSPIAVPKMQVPLMDVDVTSSLSGEIVKGSYITAYSWACVNAGWATNSHCKRRSFSRATKRPAMIKNQISLCMARPFTQNAAPAFSPFT